MANRNPQNQDKLKRTAGPGRPAGSKNKLTPERVEEELRRIALLDPIELFARKDRTFTLRELAQMPPEVRACIASIRVKTVNLTAGDDQQDTVVEIKLVDKMKALELCAKHFRWVSDKEVAVEIAGLDVLLDAWKAKHRSE